MLTKFKFNKRLVYLFLGLILLVHTVVLTKLIYFPYPELFIYPYLTNHGLKPYSQILDQHFPGPMFFLLNLNNLGMITPEIARIWSIVNVLIIHIMLFFISSTILKSKVKALGVNLLYLIWQPFFEGWVLWIDSFLPLILLPAFYSLYRGIQSFDLAQDFRGVQGKTWLFICGLLLGLGIVFKQIVFPLSVFVLIYLVWKLRDFRIVSRYILGLSIPVVLMIVYLLGIGVFGDFWYWTITFNLTTYAKFGRGGGPDLAHLSRVLLVFGSAFLVLQWIKFKETKLMLIFLIGTLLGLSTRFDFVHFQPALPFAIMATVYEFGRVDGLKRWGTLSLYGFISIWWIFIFYKGHLGNRIISFDSSTQEIATKIRSYTKPGEKIFVFGAEPQLYQMSDTLPAGNIFVFQFPWFLKVAEGRVLEGIIEDKPNIIVSDRSTKIEGQKVTEFARDIDQYISQNYRKIDSVGTVDILQRMKKI